MSEDKFIPTSSERIFTGAQANSGNDQAIGIGFGAYAKRDRRNSGWYSLNGTDSYIFNYTGEYLDILHNKAAADEFLYPSYMEVFWRIKADPAVIELHKSYFIQERVKITEPAEKFDITEDHRNKLLWFSPEETGLKTQIDLYSNVFAPGFTFWVLKGNYLLSEEEDYKLQLNPKDSNVTIVSGNLQGGPVDLITKLWHIGSNRKPLALNWMPIRVTLIESVGWAISEGYISEGTF